MRQRVVRNHQKFLLSFESCYFESVESRCQPEYKQNNQILYNRIELHYITKSKLGFDVLKCDKIQKTPFIISGAYLRIFFKITDPLISNAR
ncbi:hypothetical protein QTP88_028610 [Uroleucon formosanum]